MPDVFKPIGETGYFVSNLGDILGVRGKILKPRTDRLGYKSVDILGVNTLVHQLVAENFVDNPFSRSEVNHKDRDKSNNSSRNLEWCTHQENMEHALGMHFTVINPCGEVIKIFNLAKFCRENNLHGSNMCQVLKGTRPVHKGWRKV